MKLRLTFALAMVAGALALAAPAQAELAYKTGPEINTAEGNCFPLRAWASYTQQKNGATAVEPRVDDVFYISVDYSFFQTFDCAADFVSAEVTLPPGVAPVTTAAPICRRIGGQSPNYVYDPRAGSNCPANVSFNASTRKFGIRPRPGAVSPDFPESGRWFIGQVAPQENVLYHTLQLLVPVRATQTMTNQPIGVLVCSVGTSCATGGVNLSVTAAPAAMDPPRISFAGRAETTAIGARIPFSVNSPDNNPEFGLKTDISTSSTFSGGRPCGLTGPEILPEAPNVFVGDYDNVEFMYGDLDTIASSPCRLAPGTTYYLKACTIYFTGPGPNDYTEKDCQTTSFTTGAVATKFTPPGENTTDLAANTNVLLRQHQVVGGRPSGTLSMRYRLKGSGGGYTIGPSQSLAASLSGSSPVDRLIGGLTPWRTYEFVSCFQVTSGPLFCGEPTTATTGFATAPTDATGVTHAAATLSGQAAAPSPAGTMRFLVGTSDPDGRDPRTALTERASTAIAARTNLGAPVTAAVTGLAAATTYWWAACFDNPAGPGIEDCSPVRSFRTGSAPPAPAAPGGSTPAPGGGDPAPGGGDPVPGGGGGGGGGGGDADTLAPKASLKLKGKLRRGKKVTLRVSATDPSGIRSVTIKVGKAKAKKARKVTIKLPRRKAKIKVVVTVTDGAGNVTKVKKTLKVK